MTGLWEVGLAVAILGAFGIACVGDCDEPASIVSGEYTIGERLYGSEEPSDDWTQTVLPGAQLSIDRASNTATVIYEREGTTYQVAYELEKR